MSYWMLGNRQIFDNVVFPLKRSDDILMSGHTVLSDFQNFKYDHTFPSFILGMILLVVLPFGRVISWMIGKLLPGVFGVNLNVDEDLSNYFDALEEDDREWWKKEE